MAPPLQGLQDVQRDRRRLTVAEEPRAAAGLCFGRLRRGFFLEALERFWGGVLGGEGGEFVRFPSGWLGGVDKSSVFF